MAPRTLVFAFTAFALLSGSAFAQAQGRLNPAGEPRYGAFAFAPGFTPAPFVLDVVSGGDIAVKPLALADNCLGYAATAPDVVVDIAGRFERLTILVASAEDTTLIVNLPNGSWSCNDDTNGLNPAVVYHGAQPGLYQIWIGSYAPDTYDEAQLYISETGPEALPTTATGPDPARAATYGMVELAPNFQPSPYTVQILGGGRSRAADFLDDPACQGFVSEAPDYSVILSQSFTSLYVAVYSPADMTLVINGADGHWYCNDNDIGVSPGFHFNYATAGVYDVWIGSAEAGNYAAGILYIQETEPDSPPSFHIDTSCPGQPDSALRVGEYATVSHSDAAMYAVPETASTVIFRPAKGTRLLLVAGPVCVDERRWWRAQLSDGARGWIADGTGDANWLTQTD